MATGASVNYKSMTVSQLKDKLRATGYILSGVKDDLVQRLELADMTEVELKDKLKERKLSVEGSKQELVMRLQRGTDDVADKKKSAAKKKNPFSNVPVQCAKCDKVMSKQQWLLHFDDCWCEEGDPNALLVHAKSRDWHGAFQLLLAFKLDADFDDLDAILRDVWMECCGHISQFNIKKKILGNQVPPAPPFMPDFFAALFAATSQEITLTSHYDPDFDTLPGQRPMDDKIIKYCGDQYSINYDYDMGTTTEAKIQILGKKRLKPGDFDKLSTEENQGIILVRNMKPVVPCKKCDKPAEYVYCDFDGQFYCTESCCEADDDADPEMALPYVNSPRSGSCGYTGD